MPHCWYEVTMTTLPLRLPGHPVGDDSFPPALKSISWQAAAKLDELLRTSWSAHWTLWRPTEHCSMRTHTLAPYAGPCMDDKQKYLSFISPKSKQDTRRRRYLWRKARSLVILHRCTLGILKCSLERGVLANICIRQSVTPAPSFSSTLTGLLEAAEHTLAWHPCLKWTDTINPRDSGDLLTKQDKVSGGARRYTRPVAHEHSWAFIAYTVYLKRRMPTSCICLLRIKHTLLCSFHSCFHSRIAPFSDSGKRAPDFTCKDVFGIIWKLLLLSIYISLGYFFSRGTVYNCTFTSMKLLS